MNFIEVIDFESHFSVVSHFDYIHQRRKPPIEIVDKDRPDLYFQ